MFHLNMFNANLSTQVFQLLTRTKSNGNYKFLCKVCYLIVVNSTVYWMMRLGGDDLDNKNLMFL